MDILIDELTEAQAKAAALEEYIEGLWMTDCGLNCDGCGTLLVTEGDFASHFLVRPMDQINRNLNLGWCPESDQK